MLDGAYADHDRADRARLPCQVHSSVTRRHRARRTGWGGRGVALEPRVGGCRLGDPQPLEQGRGADLTEHGGPDLLDPDPRDEVVGPLLVLGVLAVVLQEAGGDAQRLRARRHRAAGVALADVAAGGAADADLPGALDGDDADVLDRRLGAVAGTAGHRRLDLVRGVQALPRRLHLDPERDRVAEPEAAEVGADARLHGPHRLCVRVPGGHAEVAQIAGRSSLRTPSRSIRWPPVTFTIGISYLSDDVGDPPQLGGARRRHRGSAARRRTCRRSGCSRGRGR